MAKSIDELLEDANYWRKKEGLPSVSLPGETQTTVESTVSTVADTTGQIVAEIEVETQQEVAHPVEDVYSAPQDHFACSAIGFLMGVLVTFLFFRVRIKKIKAEYEIRVSEARASLDKMISMIVKE